MAAASSGPLQPSIDDLVAAVGTSVIPPHLIERAASHARIRAAFNFVAGSRPGSLTGDGEVDEVVEVTDEAAELIDDLLGRMVEDATEQAAALAALRQKAVMSSKHVGLAPFPTSAAGASDVLASASASKAAATPAILTGADVEIYLSEVWPHVVLPTTELTRRIERQSAGFAPGEGSRAAGSGGQSGAQLKRARPG